jgi:hypothetical protein
MGKSLRQGERRRNTTAYWRDLERQRAVILEKYQNYIFQQEIPAA